MTISNATITGAGLSLSGITLPLTLQPYQTTTVTISYQPSVAGNTAGQLTVTSDSETDAILSVTVTGYTKGSGAIGYTGSPTAAFVTPTDSNAEVSPDFFGLTVLHTYNPFPNFPVSTLRFWTVAPWGTVEPTSGNYDWATVDDMIANARKNGVSDFVYTLGDVPGWASSSPNDPCTGGAGAGTCAPPNMAAFDAFATQLVQRYCGVIKYYETWNEPNGAEFWDGTNAQLLTVAQHLYQIATDPANCASSDGTNPNKVLTPSISRITTSSLTWLDTYLSGAGSTYPYADVVAFHGYGSSTAPEAIATQVPELQQVLAKHGLSGKQLWNTEADWGSTPLVTEDQASWLMRYDVALSLTGVSRFIWFAYDNCSWGTLWEGYCPSPQMPVKSMTVGGSAFAVIQNWLSGASLQGCTSYQNGLWTCEIKRPNGYVGWIVWSSAGASISVPIIQGSGLTDYRNWQNVSSTLPDEIIVDQMPVLLETAVP